MKFINFYLIIIITFFCSIILFLFIDIDKKDKKDKKDTE